MALAIVLGVICVVTFIFLNNDIKKMNEELEKADKELEENRERREKK